MMQFSPSAGIRLGRLLLLLALTLATATVKMTLVSARPVVRQIRSTHGACMEFCILYFFFVIRPYLQQEMPKRKWRRSTDPGGSQLFVLGGFDFSVGFRCFIYFPISLMK